MGKPYNKIEYNNNYKQQHYDTLRALMPKGSLELVKNFAKQNGKSVSAVTVEALEAYTKLKLSK